MKKNIFYPLIAFLALFGLVTLFLSTSIVFDWFDIRAKEGNYVLFIVLANLASSILYLISVYGFLKTKKWTTQALGISSIILVVAFVGLLVHINSGGLYETKTINAMIFRTAITVGYTLMAYFIISKKKI